MIERGTLPCTLRVVITRAAKTARFARTRRILLPQRCYTFPSYLFVAFGSLTTTLPIYFTALPRYAWCLFLFLLNNLPYGFHRLVGQFPTTAFHPPNVTRYHTHLPVPPCCSTLRPSAPKPFCDCLCANYRLCFLAFGNTRDDLALLTLPPSASIIQRDATFPPLPGCHALRRRRAGGTQRCGTRPRDHSCVNGH